MIVYVTGAVLILIGLALLGVFGRKWLRKPSYGDLASASRNHRTAERELLLEPNKFSSVKIEHYALGFEFILTLGKPCMLMGEAQPDTYFRCQVLSVNVPCPNFARVSSFATANVIGVGAGSAGEHRSPEQTKLESELPLPIVACGGSSIDLWHFREPKALIDLPTAGPSNKFRFNGFYDGKIPEGYKEGDTYRLSIMLAGPASICA